MNILVTGGAGFIGSHTVLALVAAGHRVVVIDNLSNGHADAVLGAIFIEGDIRNIEVVERALNEYEIEAVIHLAAYIEAGVSVREPVRFYENNIYGSACLLEAMRRAQVKTLVFSSTAAVFGNPTEVPIRESAAKIPTNPYGKTKLYVEGLLDDCHIAHGLNWVVLRYFNAAGADPEGRLGERHDPETHLIPLAVASAAGKRAALTVFGTDYATHDGTCVRDYIHVSDLATAHVQALDYLNAGHSPRAFNLGNGLGYTVREVLQSVERVTGHAVPHSDGPRRPGDPATLVAASADARTVLGWTPRYPALDDMVAHAWAFFKKGL